MNYVLTNHRRRFLGMVLVAVVSVLSTAASAEQPGLRYFGFAGGCDQEIHLYETAGFSNLCIIDIQDDRLLDPQWLKNMSVLEMRLIISTHGTFFEQVWQPGQPNQPYDLHPDFQRRWQRAIEGKERGLRALVDYVFVADEPHWNGITRRELARAHTEIKASLPWATTLTSFSHRIDRDWFEGQDVPVDAVGYHQYYLLDPQTDPTFQMKRELIKRHARGKEFFYVLDAWWSTEHLQAGLGRDDMAEVARNTYRMAVADSEAVAVMGFHWSRLPFAAGARDLPETVRWQYRTIGSEITGKCLAPRSTAPEHPLFLLGCDFFATMELRTPTGRRFAIAMPRDREYGNWVLSDGTVVGGLRIRLRDTLDAYPAFHTPMPARIRIYNADTGELLSEFTANGPAVR